MESNEVIPGRNSERDSAASETAKACVINAAELGADDAVQFHVDLNEGRFVALGCLSCREDVTARTGITSPFQFYVASLDCPECGEQLCEWDIFEETVPLTPRSSIQPGRSFSAR